VGPVATLWTRSFTRGLRLLKQDAAFSALAVGLLGVGMAASMALLAAFDAVILRPLPYPRPGQIVLIFSTRATQNQGVLLSLAAVPDFRAWQTRARSVVPVGFIYTEMNVGGSALVPELAQGARITTARWTPSAPAVCRMQGGSAPPPTVAIVRGRSCIAHALLKD
jgi:hypothetical protein